jgi:XTP/dITP diphosphohydrolase
VTGLSFPDEFVFVTSNAGKAREASRRLGREVRARRCDLHEIQSLSFDEVVRRKALDAASALGLPVLVDDSGLVFPAWNGYPGPLTRWTLEALGLDGLARLGDLVPGRRVEAIAALALARPGDGLTDVIVVFGKVEGTLATSPRGTAGFGFDPLFIPNGEELSWGEMSAEEKDLRSHRSLAFAALRARLAS